ncbi:MAG: NAD-dependent epimerase/dehydratase family protein [Clostridia bacterium]|nr:NAD-dependent epimerase/dehydratase family protein [Clostridia bacterium]
MKRVLITGEGSYLGEKAAERFRAMPGQFAVDTVDVRGDTLGDVLFDGYTAVLHVAGLVHQQETPDSAHRYYSVNRDLAVAVAVRAKEAGVAQFVFFSSMSVYGSVCGEITALTLPKPDTHYGRSKLEAEEALKLLEDDAFHVAVLRPPMVYGKGCRGNYPRLSALVRRLPAFPKIENQRSMIYVDCLSAFLAELVESGEGGLFFPQNQEYVSTDELVRQIARAHGIKLWQFAGLGWLIRLLARVVPTIGKVFGTLVYDQAMSGRFREEPQPAFAETIRATEAGE